MLPPVRNINFVGSTFFSFPDLNGLTDIEFFPTVCYGSREGDGIKYAFRTFGDKRQVFNYR